GRNQKTAVVDDALQGVFACVFTPANELIPATHPPSRGAEAQSAEPTKTLVPDQVTKLRATERPAAQIVIRIEQGIPYPGVFASRAADRDEFHRAKLREGTLHGEKRGKFRGTGAARVKCIVAAVLQFNQVATVKFQ